MDLSQQKLTKKEWDFLEVPVDSKEKRILKLIYEGFNDVDFTYNNSEKILVIVLI